MREIKFRAWDDARKLMIDDFQFFKSGDTNADWIIPKHAVWEDINGDNNTVDMSKYPHMRQQFEVMQYTGLNDKNGKEIYEGDILYVGEGLRHQSVRWVQWMAGFAMAISETSGTTGIPKDCEVVGNIYEILEITT